ncbi:DUF5724 domain-containing protein [Paludisphaera sp.]|uniref:DUF5724 domain-containing protein n=1 Tax=Paludisphaera sp. TaxID=2017432 RepID=UPI00301BF577
MLDREEIQKKIQAARKEKPWVEARMDRLSALDPDARAIGGLLIGIDEKGKPAGTDKWRAWQRGLARLRRLSDPEMLRLGEALFPRDPDVFRAAWELRTALPYQSGYLRRPFRAPGRPDLLREARANLLAGALMGLEGIDEDMPWLAAHAPYLATYLAGDSLGLLLAAAIDLGGPRGEEVERVLRDSASGLHEIGQMGRHVTSALLGCGRPDCWEFVAKLLMAAQRQEGLRQSILESIDFARPDAFRRMLRLIEDENLVRFSATVRAVDVWLGYQLDSAAARHAAETLRSLALYLDDDAARDEAIRGDDAEKAFLALWSSAFDDAPATVPRAATLLGHPAAEHRFVGVHMLGMLSIPDAYDPIASAVDDADPRVAVYAASIAVAQRKQAALADLEDVEDPTRARRVEEFGYNAIQPIPTGMGDLFDRLSRLFDRLPAKAKAHAPLVWPWMEPDVERRSVADWLVDALEDRPPSRLLPYLGAMSPSSRGRAAYLFARRPKTDAEARAALLKLVGDASSDVRETAVRAMRKLKVTPADLASLEPLLDRKASDLRRGILGLILSMKDADALASAGRLTAAKAPPRRLAGLDLLTQLRDAGRAVDQARALAEAYRDARPSLDRDEQVYVDKLTLDDVKPPALDDALGLMDDARRTPPGTPVDRGAKLGSPAAAELLKLLDDLVHRHREEPITLKGYAGDRESQPLGTITYAFPSPFEYNRGKGVVRPLDELPLREAWWEAWDARPKTTRDADGLEAARAVVMLSLMNGYVGERRRGWRKEAAERLAWKAPKLKYLHVVSDVVQWLVCHKVDANVADFVADGFETVLAAIPPDKLQESSKGYGGEPQWHFREHIGEFGILTGILKTVAELRGQWTAEHSRRLFELRRWVDEPFGVGGSGAAGQEGRSGPRAIERDRMAWDDVVEAFGAGWANEHDVFDELLGPRPVGPYYSGSDFRSMGRATGALRRGELPQPLAPLVEKAMERVLEVELARGESPTAATPAALALEHAGGLDTLVEILRAIGRDPKLRRTYSWGDEGQAKSSVFSRLIRATRPGADETPEDFAKAVEAAGIGEDALLAVAFYAPQWARGVERALGWPTFEEAVWWFHAHTKDSSWTVASDVREAWNAEIRKLTPLTLEDLTEGAVDVDWFARTYKALGKPRWGRLDEFAKYASAGAGHKRAQLFAAAMLGEVKLADLVKDVKDKRKQDAVRALGLLPLSKKGADKDVLERYRIMQEFVRASRKFGSQRQASEKLAARIGQENLARTAGHPDPTRLQWAMEGRESADLAEGPVVVGVGDVSVALSIDGDGRPEIAVTRGEKPLKSIPPAVKKEPAVAELVERKAHLKRSSSRMRTSLEEAMVRGDAFKAEELLELMGSVVLRPMLERLVFLGDGVTGYPTAGGKGLRGRSGEVEPIKPGEALRLAHPVDLLASRHWSEWQRDCFAAERVQPFKQVFRELYVPTAQEIDDATFSRRYAGQQVNPRQALALLGSRGWVAAPESGVFRAFHHEKLVAWIEFMETYFTPAEVEGLTLEKVRFARRGADEALKIAEVPPRLFSEVMRDVDLIVSVAHRGEVDPEASAGTVELRAALLRETLSLLDIENVRIKEPHVFIDGEFGEYNVHLGSATTHMMPGGTLVIVPVHSQHRGRIFLPFADEDPKTAEVLSKIILLARDREIRDPNLLDQIRALR